MHSFISPNARSDVSALSCDSLQIINEGEESFVVDIPDKLKSALVFASPHSGRAFPRSFFSACIAEPINLRRVEDAYVDQLFADVTSFGSPFLKALVSRACLDLNRAENELDKTIIDPPLKSLSINRTPRVQAGLGCIPRIAFRGSAIYGRKLTPHEVEKRLETVYRPYHAALNALVDKTRKKFGVSILVDCHSMPAQTELGSPLADIVLGDRFGAACASEITDRLEALLRSRGYTVARNQPYAGGYITSSQGRPEKRRHAIQIEINRNLYLDEANVKLLDSAENLRSNLMSVFQEMNSWVNDCLEKKKTSLRA